VHGRPIRNGTSVMVMMVCKPPYSFTRLSRVPVLHVYLQLHSTGALPLPSQLCCRHNICQHKDVTWRNGGRERSTTTTFIKRLQGLFQRLQNYTIGASLLLGYLGALTDSRVMTPVVGLRLICVLLYESTHCHPHMRCCWLGSGVTPS